MVIFLHNFQSIRRAVEKRNEMRILQLNHAKNGGLALQEEVSSGRSDSSFLLCKGSYNEKYCTLQQIGKGAFGCVKTAFRRSDRRMVRSKLEAIHDISHCFRSPIQLSKRKNNYKMK